MNMTEVEEPQFTTLAERIAALNNAKNFDFPSAEPVRKRPPPPPPPNRPALSTVNSSQSAKPLIPARPKPRTAATFQPDESHDATSPSPGGPPPLPGRATTFSQASPHLQPRRQRSSLSVRRNSGSSEISQHSVLSTLSVAQSASSVTSVGSNGTAYKLPPVFNPSALPPLPPSKREREAQAAKEAADAEMRLKAMQIRAAPVIHHDNNSEQSLVVAKPKIPSRVSSGSLTTTKPPLPSRVSSGSLTTTKPTLPSRPSLPSRGTSSSSTEQADARPGLPPRLPSRPTKSQHAVAETQPTQPPRKLAPRILGFGSSNGQNGTKAPPLPGSRPTIPATNRAGSDSKPPPVPVASRPSASQINAAVARTAAPPPATDDCWICRDWSPIDNHASRFPRQTLPRNDPVGYLARELTAPFPSYTDKAMAIFMWCHWNIEYDTYSFFNKCIQQVTPEQTIFSGKAVCGGYAGMYEAIATRAGLDCVMVVGHGKGYGHTPLQPGERPPPPDATGHAWNAVRIDGGDWKLLDPCWGAGHLGEDKVYKQKLDRREFIMSNDEFGLKHFPENPAWQFRDDGRTQSWDEYFIGPMQGEPFTWYGEEDNEGLKKSSVEPQLKYIPVKSGKVVRFQFSKLCEHWTYEKHGKEKVAPLLMLEIQGADGRKNATVPIETDGYWHWVDVHARDLGAPGQEVNVLQITMFDKRDARGLSAKEFLARKGKVAMGWNSIMRWQLV